jgi:uncharacterized protein YecE (DUF72 family)
MMDTSRIHVGVGGWTFEPWRDNFYPKGLKHADELKYASSKLTAIEINGTFYSTFKPAHYAKWRDDTPAGFVFSLKAHRFATHRKELGTAGESIGHFCHSGIAELRDRLGPIVWQLMPSTKFDPAQVGAFFSLLPQEVGGLRLRHVLEPRHASFVCDEYLDLARSHGLATVHTDSGDYPSIGDGGSDLAYLRLMRSDSACETGYPVPELQKWAEGAKAWVGQAPGKEVFMYFISGAKEKNPAAAMAMLSML